MRFFLVFLLCLTMSSVGMTQQGPLSLTQDQTTQQGKRPFISPVRVGTLEDITFDSVGILDVGNGGLTPDIWQQTDYDSVTLLLEQMPTRIESPALRRLAVQVLATSASAPQKIDQQSPWLAVLRIEKLLEMGEFAKFKKMLEAVPATMKNPKILRLQSISALLDQEYEKACIIIDNALRAEYDDIFWQKADVFCHLQDRDTAKARFKLGLLEEQGVELPATFMTLVEIMSGAPAAPDASLRQFGFLEYFMLKNANAQFSLSTLQPVLQDASPGIWKLLASTGNVDVQVRVRAAQLAEKYGLYSTDELKELYESVLISPQNLAGALDAMALGQDISPSYAVLYQALKNQRDQKETLEFIQKALNVGKLNGDYNQLARLFADEIIKIIPQPEHAWFATTAIHALYAANMSERSDAWQAILTQTALATGISSPPLQNIVNLENLSQLQVNGALGQLPVEKLGDLYLLTGYSEFLVDKKVRETMLGYSQLQLPVTPLFQQLNAAARNYKKGKTILLILQLVKQSGNRTHPVTESQIIKASLAADLKDTADTYLKESILDIMQ